MFSGLIDHTGTITNLQKTKNALKIQIQSNFTALEEGESIAVDGICLTVTDFNKSHFYCDISPETLALTTAEEFQLGQKLNLERALRVGDRLGGHWVTGHVDQRAQVQCFRQHPDYLEIEISGVLPESMPYLVKKGSITINGVSLTLNEITATGFRVLLIPHTLKITNLDLLLPQSKVNLEFDCLAKMVAHQLKTFSTALKLPAIL